METLSMDTETLITIIDLAKQLNTSKKEVVRQAINDYVEKIKLKNSLRFYAGILEENEADELLNSIQQNRLNKSWGTI